MGAEMHVVFGATENSADDEETGVWRSTARESTLKSLHGLLILLLFLIRSVRILNLVCLCAFTSNEITRQRGALFTKLGWVGGTPLVILPSNTVVTLVTDSVLVVHHKRKNIQQRHGGFCLLSDKRRSSAPPRFFLAVNI